MNKTLIIKGDVLRDVLNSLAEAVSDRATGEDYDKYVNSSMNYLLLEDEAECVVLDSEEDHALRVGLVSKLRTQAKDSAGAAAAMASADGALTGTMFEAADKIERAARRLIRAGKLNDRMQELGIGT